MDSPYKANGDTLRIESLRLCQNVLPSVWNCKGLCVHSLSSAVDGRDHSGEDLFCQDVKVVKDSKSDC